MSAVAEFPGVHCKLSGLVTQADPGNLSPKALKPYVDHVVSVFGPDRVMFGSDWPVCRLAAEYGAVVNVLRTILTARLDAVGLDKVFQTNGAYFYRLEPGV
jgi:L-fuconolactonase